MDTLINLTSAQCLLGAAQTLFIFIILWCILTRQRRGGQP